MSGAYFWRADLIGRHSMTLCGPQGWLAHVLRDEDGSWYGFTCAGDDDEQIVIDNQPTARDALAAMFSVSAGCTTHGCSAERTPGTVFCPQHQRAAA